MPEGEETFGDSHWAALRAHAYQASEATEAKMPGWARWHFVPGRWEPRHLADLEGWGLIEVRREYMDNWVKPTDTGWHLLATAAPDIPVPGGQPHEG